jgi:putative ABC transport system ATP-binding protein
MQPDVPAVEAIDVTRIHNTHGAEVRALDGVSITAARGEVVAVVGPSGSGKSTLLFLLAGLDTPDGGHVLVNGSDWASMQGSDRARFRRRTCGFVVQGMALLPQATAAENIEVPLVLDDVDQADRRTRVAEALERVGLTGEAMKLPDQLSGGQQQRVAIARALVTRPAVVLADEPTGNLDSATGQAITRLLVDIAAERGTAIILVTHDPAVAAHADRIVELHSGHVNGAGART